LPYEILIEQINFIVPTVDKKESEFSQRFKLVALRSES